MSINIVKFQKIQKITSSKSFFARLWKLFQIQSKFLVKFCLSFFVLKISIIYQSHRSSYFDPSNKSFMVDCLCKIFLNSQILIIMKGEKYCPSIGIWSGPKHLAYSRTLTGKNGKKSSIHVKSYMMPNIHQIKLRGKF